MREFFLFYCFVYLFTCKLIIIFTFLPRHHHIFFLFELATTTLLYHYCSYLHSARLIIVITLFLHYCLHLYLWEFSYTLRWLHAVFSNNMWKNKRELLCKGLTYTLHQLLSSFRWNNGFRLAFHVRCNPKFD